ncbi:MAG TPA: hypothetical protein VE029_15250 [Rhizobacter sp.]|nr:hypothetical protein [Rhizobacter sp.]
MHALLEQFTLKAPRDLASRSAPLMADLKLLSRFRSKMAQQALAVNVARMVFDRTYAFEHLALAHSTADPSLRRLALRLFAQYTQPNATATH